MEITASLRKFVISLSSAKHRREEGAFIAEGTKCVCDTLSAFSLRYLFATQRWIDEHPMLPPGDMRKTIVTGKREIERMSSLSTPSEVLAVYDMPNMCFNPGIASKELVVALDGVQDPGNVGTIIRAADWFGVRHILLSEDCADAFSPKTIMATMGAISRVRIWRGDLYAMLRECGNNIFGTFLDGDSIYESPLSSTGVIVMGSEGNGISDNIGSLVSKRILIPSYPADAVTSESLNVGMATSIVLAEFRRREIMK